MNPEERALLDKTYKMVEENNTILRAMRRSARFDKIFRYGYWILIIVSSYFAYVSIQPYFNTIMGMTGKDSGSADSGTPAKGVNYQELLNQLKDLQK